MSRSRALIMTLVVLLFILPARSALAQKHAVIDAIAALDYLHGRSSIQVGTWVKYRTTGQTSEGVTDEYTSTVLIAGEEEFWGEDCFWVETQTDLPGGEVISAATLMSYAIFDDSLAIPHIQVYQRKRITEVTADGNPLEQVVRRGESQLKNRNPFGTGLKWVVDTLGTDTVRTPRGDVLCLKVKREQGATQLAESADSTQYSEVRKSRTDWETMDVPLTHYAREEFRSEVRRRTWLTGRSQEAGQLRVVDLATGTVELLDYGTSGVKAQLVPGPLRRSLAAQRAEEDRAAKTAAAPARAAKARAGH